MKVSFFPYLIICYMLVSCYKHEPVGEPTNVRVARKFLGHARQFNLNYLTRKETLRKEIFNPSNSEAEMTENVVAYLKRFPLMKFSQEKVNGVWEKLLDDALNEDRMKVIDVLVSDDAVRSMINDDAYPTRARLLLNLLRDETKATEILAVALKNSEKSLVEGFLRNEGWDNKLFSTLLEEGLITDKVSALDVIGRQYKEHKGMANIIIDKMNIEEAKISIGNELAKDNPNIVMAKDLAERKGVELNVMRETLASIMSSDELVAKKEVLKGIWPRNPKEISQVIADTTNVLLDKAIKEGRADVIKMLVEKDNSLDIVSLWLRALENSNNGIQKEIVAITRAHDPEIEEKVVKHFLNEEYDEAKFKSLLKGGLIKDKVSALDVVGRQYKEHKGMANIIMDSMTGKERTKGFNDALGQSQPRLSIARKLLERGNVDVGETLSDTLISLSSGNPQKTDFKRFEFLLENADIDIKALSSYSAGWNSPMHKFVTIVSSYGKGLDSKVVKGTLKKLQDKKAKIGSIEDSKEFWEFLQVYATPKSEVETNRILIQAIKNTLKINTEKSLNVEAVPRTVAGAKTRSGPADTDLAKRNANIINWINRQFVNIESGIKSSKLEDEYVSKSDELDEFIRIKYSAEEVNIQSSANVVKNWSSFTDDHHKKFIELAPNLKVTDEGSTAPGMQMLLKRLDSSLDKKSKEVLKVQRDQITSYLKMRVMEILNMSVDMVDKDTTKRELYHDLMAAAINLRRQVGEGNRLWWVSELNLSEEPATRVIQKLERQEIARLLLGESDLIVTPQ